MAKRTASAKKQARAGARRAVRNRGVRSEVKTLIVKARRALNETPADGLATALDAVRALDRASAKGILHPNNAARRKARLARQVAKLATAAPAPAKGKKPAPAKAAPAKAAPAAAKKK